MAVKKIYFVRHGEVNSNAKKLIPGKDESLNETGLMQATQLAERIVNIHIDKLFVSDFTRTLETAELIAKQKGLPLNVMSLLGEMREPTSFVGLSDFDDVVLAYRKERNENLDNSTWKYEDGESIMSIQRRVLDIRKLLVEETAENILVVSHTFFIRYFVASVLLGTVTVSPELVRVAKTLQLSNSGVSLLTFDEDIWRVVMFNDHAHFAE